MDSLLQCLRTLQKLKSVTRKQVQHLLTLILSFPHRAFLLSVTSFLFPLNAHNMFHTHIYNILCI